MTCINKTHTNIVIDKAYIKNLEELTKSIPAFLDRLSMSDALLFGNEQILFDQYLNNDYSHYFLEKGLPEFLISSVKNIDAAFYKSLPFHNGFMSKPRNIPKIYGELKEWDKFLLKTGTKKGFAIHFHRSDFDRSLLVVGRKATSWGHEGLIVGNFDDVFYWRNDDEKYDWGKLGETNTDLLKLVLGFSLYIDAFPELVKDHDEKSLKWKLYNGKRKIVLHGTQSTSDQKNSVSPHYRRGHFRLLTSEKYKKKRGHVVFVKGCFINGKAFDVITD